MSKERKATKRKRQDARLLGPSELRVFKQLAAHIKDDEHLAHILQGVPTDRREAVHSQIVKCTKFKAKPFADLQFI